jgi:hypothetical protein
MSDILHTEQANAAQLMVEMATERGMIASISGANSLSGSSWYVTVDGYKVRISDHRATRRNDFYIDYSERTGWNGCDTYTEAIEEVLDEIAERKLEEEDEE